MIFAIFHQISISTRRYLSVLFGLSHLSLLIHTGLHCRAEPGEFTLSIFGSLSIVVVG